MQQFNIGDVVAHPVYGICHIVTIEERQFSQEAACLYYQIALSKRQLWVPVAAQATSGLRLIITSLELDQYRALLEKQPAALPKNQYQRQRELLSRSKESSFQAMCELVRDLTAWRRHNRLNAIEAKTLQETRERLYREWAIAAGISVTKAISEIDTLLQASYQNPSKSSGKVSDRS
jgi:RNA polymerase-interacting CarD/CdnL/TRCF family regulator